MSSNHGEDERREDPSVGGPTDGTEVPEEPAREENPPEPAPEPIPEEQPRPEPEPIPSDDELGDEPEPEPVPLEEPRDEPGSRNDIPAEATDEEPTGEEPEEQAQPVQLELCPDQENWWSQLTSWWQEVSRRVVVIRNRRRQPPIRQHPPAAPGNKDYLCLIARILERTWFSCALWTGLIAFLLIQVGLHLFPTDQYWQGAAWLGWTARIIILLAILAICLNRPRSADAVAVLMLVLIVLFAFQGHFNIRGQAVQDGGVIAANNHWYAAMEEGGIVVGKGNEWIHTQYDYGSPIMFHIVRWRGFQRILVRVVQTQVSQDVPPGKIAALNASRRFREYDPSTVPAEEHLASAIDDVRWTGWGISSTEITCPDGWEIKNGSAVKKGIK